MASLPLNYTQSTPGVCGGRPRIAGHRIRVQDIAAWLEKGGYSADEIVASIDPDLTPAKVCAALAYFDDHRDEVRADMNGDDAFVKQLSSQTPSLLARKLSQRIGSMELV